MACGPESRTKPLKREPHLVVRMEARTAVRRGSTGLSTTENIAQPALLSRAGAENL